MSIPILFEDAEALVIDKPAGLPVAPPRRGGPSLDDHLDELRLNFMRRPVPVHRLDADTSGCLLLARNPKALKRFQRAFENRLVDKRYLGVLAGEPPDAEGTIDLPLLKVSSEEAGWRMIVDADGKASVTRWRLLAVHGGNSLVEFHPVTGRTHQIRIHAAEALGHGLVGDPVYGANPRNDTHTMLHASQIKVEREGKPPVMAEAPFPQVFRDLGFEP